jgi:hypothetical protein
LEPSAGPRNVLICRIGAFADAGKYPADVREVTVVVSDPWDFVDDHGSNVFAATVRARSEDLVLLEIAGQFYVANPRGTPEAYSLTPTTAELVRGGPPWGQDAWRGQPTALLANIRGL